MISGEGAGNPSWAYAGWQTRSTVIAINPRTTGLIKDILLPFVLRCFANAAGDPARRAVYRTPMPAPRALWTDLGPHSESLSQYSVLSTPPKEVTHIKCRGGRS